MKGRVVDWGGYLAVLVYGIVGSGKRFILIFVG